MSMNEARRRAYPGFLLAVLALMGAPLKAQSSSENLLALSAAGGEMSEASSLPALREPAEWPETATVRELLRIDAERAALAARQSWLKSPRQEHGGFASNQPGPDLQATDRIQVKGIYGVAGRLHAEVVINGRTLYYARGQSLPDGERQAARNGAYALLAIEGRCLRLRKGAAIRTVCLGASGEAS